jgi:hypothetical protein
MLRRGSDPPQAAAWVEGFLSASGLVLLHHEELLAIIDAWLIAIPAEVFVEQVPLLRRTFSGFAAAERRQIGERVRAGIVGGSRKQAVASQEIDESRANRVLPILRLLFGAQAGGGLP